MATPENNLNRRRRPPGALLFPVAAGYAAAAIPVWVGLHDGSHGMDAWHGHEMLFGYALAVVAGFLVNDRGAVRWLLPLTWAAARAAPAVAIPPLAATLSLTFPAALATVTLPPLLRAAKRRRNLILPGVLALLLAADGLWWTGALRHQTALQTRALLATVDLIALLLITVGGRALPAAVGGYLERHGHHRRDHTRGAYEPVLAVLLLAACALDAAGEGAAAGWLLVAAGLITALRVSAWQLHYSLARPELWSLALGYLWLVPGLLLKGLAQAAALLPATTALHAVTAGALGTLTLVMMARTAALRAHRPLDGFTDVGIGALLVSAATVLRLVATSEHPAVLWAAAGCWSLAFALLLVRLLRTGR